MAEHEKHTHEKKHDSQQAEHGVQVGHTVKYTGHDGRQHDATVEQVQGDRLDLVAQIDGAEQRHAGVSRSTFGGAHTWDHAQRQ